MTEKFLIMVVEDEKLAGRAICDNLSKEGYQCALFEKGEEALSYFQTHPVDLAVLDYRLPGMNGEELFKEIKEINPMAPVIFMTAYSSVEKAVHLLKMGAFTYLTKPIEIEELLHDIGKALEGVTLRNENRRLKEHLKEKFSFENYIFNSPKMQEVINLVLRAASSSANILLTGESGTGKEVITNIIHVHSPRGNQKLVKANLAALPETLVEAELFGAVKGAYTGSVAERTGKFQEADKGTIFLDEIGELPADVQVKLLRTIQEREITRLGSNSPVKIDIRLITATNKDLHTLVKEHKFREDLFFRLNVINIHLPPLRERREDIKLLVDLFIKKYNHRENKSISHISKEALDTLIKYDYPGNIRELENIIERAVVLARDEVLGSGDLPVFMGNARDPELDHPAIDSSLPLPERIQIIEKNIIRQTLEKNHYNQTRTAAELGISESGLRYKIQSLHIKK